MKDDFDIRVISLNRARKRRKEFRENNKDIDFSFFDAVDGNKLTTDDLTNTNYFVQPLPMRTKGAYGCALSHLTLWQECIKTNKNITIVEDDVIFRKDFYNEASKVLYLAEDFDIILWGVNMDSVLSLDIMPKVTPAFLRFSESTFRKHLENFKNETSKAYPHKLFWSLGIPAYTISPKGAKQYIKKCLPLKDFNHDVAILDMQYFDREVIRLCCDNNYGIDVNMAVHYRTSKSYVSLPPLALSPNIKNNSYIHPSNKNNIRPPFKVPI